MPLQKGHKINLGRKQSKETIEKRVSKFRGKKRKPTSKETREKMSNTRKGKPMPWLFLPEIQEKARLARIGKKRSLESRTRMRNAQLKIAKKGSASLFWKGGITPQTKKIRTSLEYRMWRESVFRRDNFTCIWCGVKSGCGKTVILHADHIKPFAYFPELRFAIDNGRTLCIDCHKKTDNYAGRTKRFPQLFR